MVERSPPPAASILPRGAAVGRFVVLDRIGQGGMGVVYAAYDPELDRKLALKLIREGSGDGETARERGDRLAREAKAMAKLTHPNVVTVYDVGRMGAEIYVAMELVDGATLRQWGAASPRDWREVVAVMRGAARGLAAAHDAGIVHRDFKPDNVLVDGAGRARVADFGLAREARRFDASGMSDQLASDPGGSETAEGTVIGTPSYMAPELFDGVAASPASDQFSFFVAMYELLFGGRPFVARDFAALAAAMKLQRFATAPTGAVPGWLRRMVLRGIAADPAARWPSMNAVAAMLARDPNRTWTLGLGATACIAALGGAVINLGPAPPCEGGAARLGEVWDGPRRDAVVAAFAGTGLPWATAAAERSMAAVDAYGTAWIAAHHEACAATEIRREQSSELLDLRMACLLRARQDVAALVTAWTAADPDVVAAADASVAALPQLDRCADPEALRGGAAPSLSEDERARVALAQEQLARAAVARRAVHFDEAVTALEQASDALAGLEQVATFAELQLELGRLAAAQGDLRAAPIALARALTSAEAGAHDRVRLAALLQLGEFEAGTLSDPRAGRARLGAIEALWRRLGQPEADAFDIAEIDVAVLRGEGKLADALERSREAVALADRDALPSAGATRGRMAGLLAELGRFAEAEQIAAEALAMTRDRFGDGHPSTANAAIAAAGVFGKQKKWAQAEPLLAGALADLRASFGDRHPRVADAMHQLANALRHRGENDRALALYEGALAIREVVLAPNHPKLAESANTLGVHLSDLGRHAEALPLFDRALAIRRHAFGERHNLVAMVLGNRATTLADTGQTELAEASIREALEIREAALGPDHHDTANTRERLGNRLRESGRLGEADTQLRRALAANEKIFGPDSDVVATNLVNLGLLQLDLRHFDEAASMCGRALVSREAKLGPDNHNLVYPLDCLGNAALGRLELATAASLFERALAILATTPDRHALWGEASYGLARALAKRDRARARTMIAQALVHYRAMGPARAGMVAEIEAFSARLDR